MKASFIPPMLLLRTEKLPEGDDWLYALKLDGFRSIAFKTAGKLHLRSRNNKDFNGKFPHIAKALEVLPDETAIDGEVVALDERGLPSFNALQNSSSSNARVVFYVFDIMMLTGKDLMREPLSARLELLETKLLPKLKEPIRYLPELKASLSELIVAVKAQAFEGLVAKRRDSKYEPGLRSGVWKKMRVNAAQDFVIGGYSVGNPFDALVFGYYDGSKLIYAGRTRNGFTPASRAAVFKKFKGLEIEICPFVNLPQAKAGRWGQGLTAEKMKQCRWLKPGVVARIEFLEWTSDGNLRHTKFIALRDDKKAKDIVRERQMATGEDA